MSRRWKSLDIESLTVAERMALVEEIWDTIVRDQAALKVSEAQKAELDRRLQAHEASPDEGASWEEVKARLRTEK